MFVGSVVVPVTFKKVAGWSAGGGGSGKRGAWGGECRGEGSEPDRSKYVALTIGIEIRARAEDGESSHNQEGRP